MALSETRWLTVVAVVALVALAGCSGVLGGDETSTTPETTAAGPDAEVDETQLRSDAVDAIAAVESYRVTATQEVVVQGPRTRRSTITDDARIDRTERELRRNRTVVAGGQQVNYTQYVVDQTFYARSDVYVRQYSSEWVKSEFGDFSTAWGQQDTLGQLRTILGNASDVTVTGVETVDGREAYRTRVNITGSAFESVLFDVVGVDRTQAESVNVTSVEYVYWLDRATSRPLRTSARLNFSATLTGRTVEQRLTTEASYDYGSVAVELPEAAGDAVNLTDGARLSPPSETTTAP
jgi:hypothetical protein